MSFSAYKFSIVETFWATKDQNFNYLFQSNSKIEFIKPFIYV